MHEHNNSYIYRNSIYCVEEEEEEETQESSQLLEKEVDISKLSLDERKSLLYQRLDEISNNIETHLETNIYNDVQYSESNLQSAQFIQTDANDVKYSDVEQPNDVVEEQYAIGYPPSTSLLLQFDQVMTQKILKYHTHWLLRSYV